NPCRRAVGKSRASGIGPLRRCRPPRNDRCIVCGPAKEGDMSAVQELTVRRNGPFAGYSDEPTPLAGYALLLAGWTGLFGGLLVAGDRRGILPERIATGDIVLTGIATHKLTRIVTRDWVTSPIRAPFVRYEASVGGGEVSEKARGRGLRRAVGDLLT